MAQSKRYSFAEAILGPEQRERLTVRKFGPRWSDLAQTTRLLMVGAGGIGCELLKNCVLAGIGDITVLDLDTIDLSNLNRQFLFNKSHVKRSKALVAKETASQFNPHVKITAIHGNIKDVQYDVAFFQSFEIVLGALDNVDARRHVNKMCMAANVPLIESGSAGYSGQVEPIKRDLSCCYDCSPKETPKTFPVCTIRSTPSTPIHCIVWAKSYLFPQLFGPDDDTDAAALDTAASSGENANEIAELRKEADAIKQIRATLAAPGAVERVFDKVYKLDVERLLKMDDMWRSRKRPTPLSYDALASAPQSSGTANGTAEAATSALIRDQRALSLHDSFELFLSSFGRLVARQQADPSPLDWDKDDDDALDFATAAANLRASVFAIPLKTRFEVKQMAGNIIPAIATTNAIVAGLIVLQALKALRDRWADARIVYVARGPTKATSWAYLPKPNPRCPTCQTPYVALQADVGKLTLGTFVREICPAVGLPGEGGVAVSEGARVLFDPDFEDNEPKTLAELGITDGAMLTVADEEGDLTSVVFLLSLLSSTTDADRTYQLPSALPSIPNRLPPLPAEEIVASEPAPSLKRKADEAELGHDSLDAAAASKRLRVDETTGVIDLDGDDEPTSAASATAADDGIIELD